jgi:hypothetical protein
MIGGQGPAKNRPRTPCGGRMAERDHQPGSWKRPDRDGVSSWLNFSKRTQSLSVGRQTLCRFELLARSRLVPSTRRPRLFWIGKEEPMSRDDLLESMLRATVSDITAEKPETGEYVPFGAWFSYCYLSEVANKGACFPYARPRSRRRWESKSWRDAGTRSGSRKILKSS